MGKTNTKGNKKILIACIAVALVAVAVVGLLLLWPNGEDAYRTIVAAEVSGTVLVSNDRKQNVPAYEGMALYDGDTISVGEDASMTVELDGDKYMMAEAGTKFRLEATGKAGSDKTVIHLESGAALTRIKNALNEDQSYVVETPNSVISVRGTVWRTSLSKNAEGKLVTLCEVFGGLVEMSAAGPSGESRRIPGGASASVTELLGCSEIGALDYRRVPMGILEILRSFLADGEVLDATKEELEDYLHEHTYADSWTYDENEHWHGATCAHPSERKDVQAHTWNEGEITKQPTHLAEGEKTYVCTVCAHTKSEAVEKLTEHIWGDWKAEGDNHVRSCECGATQSEAHTWNEGEITKQPTHLAEGEKTYICTVCAHTKTELIEKLTEHTWSEWMHDGENTQQHYCQCVCGEKKWEDHNFDGQWLVGQNGHYQTCTVCRTAISAEQSHSGGTATCAQLAVCTSCGASYGSLRQEHHYTGPYQSNENGHWQLCADCDQPGTSRSHSFDSGVLGSDPSGEEAKVYTCTVCLYKKYEIVQNAELTEFDGQFAVDGVGYETWYEAAMALSGSSSRTVLLLRDLMYDVFSYVYGTITLPYDNTDTMGTPVPAFYEMAWDLNGCGVSLFSESNSTDITPPRICEGTTWTIRATGGGMLKTEGKGLYLPWYGGVLEGEIVILGGMFDFDPTEYVPAGYTVRMVLAPDFVQGSDWSVPSVDYATILAQYGTYSAIMNDRDKDEAELYQCRTPGLWIVYADGQAPSGCDHACFTYVNTVDDVAYNYCSGCGQLVDHRHSATWLKNPDEHTQECATCYEILVEWDVHTYDAGVPSVNEFGENATLYTCTVCGFRDMRVTCTGEHIYGTGAQGTASWGATVMIYSCIYCDHQVTIDTLHECEGDWDNPVYNRNYHWYACTTAGCPARIDYGIHSYEKGCPLTDAPTHDQPGITVSGCYCGYWLPGSEVHAEFYDYFLDFSGCTAEGINQYDNTIYIGDAFDYENVNLIGYYSDTALVWDDDGNIIGCDLGRVLNASEYAVRIYRVYSWDQRLLLSTLDLTVPGEYEIEYVTSEGYWYTIELTVLARPTDGYTWLTVKPEGATDHSAATKVTYALADPDGHVGQRFTASVNGEGMTNTELNNVDLGLIQQLQIQVALYDPTGEGFYMNFTVMEGYDVWVFTQDESGNGYLGYAGSSYWFGDTVKYIVVLHSDYTMDEAYRLELTNRLSGYGSGSIFSDPNEGFVIRVVME